jgi:hypothetical protein
MNKNSFSKADLEKIEEIQNKRGIKTFTEAVRTIVRDYDGGSCGCEGECTCGDTKLSDDNFALLADAIVEMDKKLDILLMHIAPKSAGEVK